MSLDYRDAQRGEASKLQGCAEMPRRRLDDLRKNIPDPNAGCAELPPSLNGRLSHLRSRLDECQRGLGATISKLRGSQGMPTEQVAPTSEGHTLYLILELENIVDAITQQVHEVYEIV